MPSDPLTYRRQAAHRLEPLPCGCLDPWPCHHRRPEPLDDVTLDSWESAAAQLASLGLPPVLPPAVERALRRRSARRRLLELSVA